MTTYTEDLCVGGIITAIDEESGFPATNAFDGGNNYWFHYFSATPLPSWIQYQFTEPKRVRRLKLHSLYIAGVEAVKDFELFGSNTGAFSGEERSIYTGTHPNESTDAFVTYDFNNNNNAYTYYRIVITSVHPGNNANTVGIREIEMMDNDLVLDFNPNRPDTIRGLYNEKKTNLRGQAKAGYVRPTIKQFFTSYDWEAVQSSVLLGYRRVSVNGTPMALDYAGSFHEPAGAFDEFTNPDIDDDEYSGWLKGGAAYPTWLGYDLGAGNEKVVTKIELREHPNYAFNIFPTDFILQGSNNNTDWDDLYTETNGAVPTVNYQLFTYDLSNNSTAYRYYRILINTDPGGGSAGIGEMTLYEKIMGQSELITEPNTAPLSYTANVCVGGTATASSEANSTWNVDEAFSGSVTEAFDWQTASWAGPHWIKYDFGVSNEKIVEKVVLYSSYSASYVNRMPKDFIIQGSSDDEVWYDLYTGTNQIWTAEQQSKEFTFNNNNDFRYYRIFITSNNDGAGEYIHIGRVEMMEGVY